MKKVLFMMLAVVMFAGCSKEDENQNQLENIIQSMGQSQLSAMDIMKSADSSSKSSGDFPSKISRINILQSGTGNW